jgi:exodeoxyribonuclease VII small subunit
MSCDDPYACKESTSAGGESATSSPDPLAVLQRGYAVLTIQQPAILYERQSKLMWAGDCGHEVAEGEFMVRGRAMTDVMNFEQALDELEQIVEHLQQDTVPLDEAVALFDGSELAQHSETLLAHAELQVQQRRRPSANVSLNIRLETTRFRETRAHLRNEVELDITLKI